MPIDDGPFAAQAIERERWDAMLDRLYTLHGWDVQTGLQTRAGLLKLGLGDVAGRLAEAGKLVG